MSRCRHRRSHCAAATALPPSRCAPPPQRRRQAATNVALAEPPFDGWLLRCCPPSDFVIHAVM
jgi:hypothetical protein